MSISGTMIPKSGGDYAYIGEAFGDLPAFLYLWVALFILVPTGNAITALTFAQNILKPLWPVCEPPADAVSLIAAVITCKLYNNYPFSYKQFSHTWNFISKNRLFIFRLSINIVSSFIILISSRLVILVDIFGYC